MVSPAIVTPVITVADLHAGTHRYTLVFDNATRKINERYIRLYHYRPGQDTRIITLPTAIAMLLSYAKKSYGLHACSHAGECARNEPSELSGVRPRGEAPGQPSELNTNIVTIARDQGYCLDCRRETGNCVCSAEPERPPCFMDMPGKTEPVHAF